MGPWNKMGNSKAMKTRMKKKKSINFYLRFLKMASGIKSFKEIP